MEFNTHFISQNVAPVMSNTIKVYTNSGKEKGSIQLNKLKSPSNLVEKIYSFGALSDIHLGSTMNGDASVDFRKALTYFTQIYNVNFTCICGDLTNFGTIEEYTNYKNHIDKYSPNTSVYAISGNHDALDQYNGGPSALTLTNNGITPYTGNPLFYTFEQNNDLFIMMGIRRWDSSLSTTEDLFSVEELQWLYDTLEANRDKRCFLFQHALRFDGCGRPYGGWPTVNLLNVEQGQIFLSIVSHYPNVIWFHGHSHTCFDSQEDNDMANYDHAFGCHSIHIPSLATPREYENSAYVGKTAESEGYIVDVYENHIILRGRDFVSEKFLPIANYCIDTTFTPVEANTFTDPTNTIIT